MYVDHGGEILEHPCFKLLQAETAMISNRMHIGFRSMNVNRVAWLMQQYDHP